MQCKLSLRRPLTHPGGHKGEQVLAAAAAAARQGWRHDTQPPAALHLRQVPHRPQVAVQRLAQQLGDLHIGEGERRAGITSTRGWVRDSAPGQYIPGSVRLFPRATCSPIATCLHCVKASLNRGSRRGPGAAGRLVVLSQTHLIHPERRQPPLCPIEAQLLRHGEAGTSHVLAQPHPGVVGHEHLQGVVGRAVRARVNKEGPGTAKVSAALSGLGSPAALQCILAFLCVFTVIGSGHPAANSTWPPPTHPRTHLAAVRRLAQVACDLEGRPREDAVLGQLVQPAPGRHRPEAC